MFVDLIRAASWFHGAEGHSSNPVNLASASTLGPLGSATRSMLAFFGHPSSMK